MNYFMPYDGIPSADANLAGILDHFAFYQWEARVTTYTSHTFVGVPTTIVENQPFRHVVWLNILDHYWHAVRPLLKTYNPALGIFGYDLKSVDNKALPPPGTAARGGSEV